MKTENLITDPIKATYKAGVYGTMGFIGIFLATFIAWSFSCLGGACVELVSKFI